MTRARAVFALSLFVAACRTESAVKSDVAEVNSRPALATTPVPPQEPTPPPTPETLGAAIVAIRPDMGDSSSGLDAGAKALTKAWVERRYTWAELSSVPETKRALVLKDSDAERGKRLCTSGTIIEIAKAAKGVFEGVIMNDATDISSFIALGSTGTLVARDSARFCGIVIGRRSYENSGGGTTHSVQIVGMFDLPENKPKK